MSVVNKKERKPTNLEIFFLDKKELEEMTSSPQFHDFVKEETYNAVKYAIKNKLDFVDIFKLWNLGYVVKIEKSEYKKALNSTISLFEKKEDYTSCSQITKLINKL